MFYKVNFTDGKGKKDSLYYGGLTTQSDIKRRKQLLKKNGFKINSCYLVKNIK